MKKIGLAAAVALIFLVSGNLTFAQSLNYHSYELMDMLEYLYPKVLAPAPQITKLDQDGALYRRYSDTGVMLKTKDDHLYLVDGGGSHDVGMIDGFVLPFAQAEVLFNWLETQFPQYLAPAPQATQVAGEAGEVLYRAYPETNTAIGTYDKDLYFIDRLDRLHLVGRVNVLLGDNIDFDSEEVLAGVYTIQQKSTGRYVDAYVWSSHDYRLVTREPRNDDTQKWIIKPLGNNVYTIQQKYAGRYVDAYVWSSEDYRLVTREPQNDDTQKWIIKPLGNNVYTIQQKYAGRYVDAYVWSSEDYQLVTREPQNDDTQKWILTLVPEGMTFKGIEYDLDEAEISPSEVVVIATQRLANNSPLEQTMMFAVNETVQEESHFERTVGFAVEVGRQLTVGVPFMSASASISISAGITWTSGQSITRSHSYTATFPLTVEPNSVFRASAFVRKSKVSVPYVMFFESNETGAIRVSRGTWSGVSTWGLDYEVTKE